MSDNISPLFGNVVNTWHFRFESDSPIAVMEQFLKDKWIILYCITEGKFVVFAQHILLDSWNSLGPIRRRALL